MMLRNGTSFWVSELRQIMLNSNSSVGESIKNKRFLRPQAAGREHIVIGLPGPFSVLADYTQKNAVRIRTENRSSFHEPHRRVPLKREQRKNKIARSTGWHLRRRGEAPGRASARTAAGSLSPSSADQPSPRSVLCARWIASSS